MKLHNFYSGPAILPQSVMEEAAQACVEYKNQGLSILEMSHRSAPIVEIMEEAEALVRELLNIHSDYAVLFLTGGASSQFYMAAMNLLGSQERAAYIDTGRWSTNAIQESSLFGQIDVIASSKDKNYTYIPKAYTIPAGVKYLHITSNNTVRGTQYASLPETDLPIVSDASSDIFTKPLDIERFGLIYAGAQKNLGPAGTTLVIVRKDLLGKIDRDIPTMLDYRTMIKKHSAFNTPPVFPIFVSMLTLRWLKAAGGVSVMQERNAQKATLFYDAIDASPLFNCPIAEEDRSLVNAVFTIKDESLTTAFLEACQAADCIGLKGHRSVGGFRASMYNAMPIESVKILVEVIGDFSAKYA